MTFSILTLFGISLLILFFIHVLLYYYLEISNNYSDYPFAKLDFFEIFTYYNKKVKPQDLKVVKLSNITLKYSGILFVIYFILSTLSKL